VGAGISGLAAAALLGDQGHEVTIFERFEQAGPVGSGLVLQQTGLAVLANLGLDRAALAHGARLTRFEGKTFTGKRVFDLSHEAPGERRLSLGIHRHALFSLLHEKARSSGVAIVTGFSADAVLSEKGEQVLQSKEGRRHEGFDLVIDSSGAHSVLRDRYADVRHRKPYAHGALWGVCEIRGSWPLDTLRQRFRRANVSVGVIPIGRKPGAGDTQHAGLHWSIRNADHAEWRRRPFAEWRGEAIRLWPEAEGMINQLRAHDDLVWAVYEDVALERSVAGRIAFVGDAAHSISPRLGQGANLGLVDALVLSRSLGCCAGVDEALRRYDLERRSHVRFYHAASKWLSVVFQSDSVVAPVLRDLCFSPVSRIPYMRRQMLESLSGIKTGLFSTIEMETLYAGMVE